MNTTIHDIDEFLRESNAIEAVTDEASLQQAWIAWQYLIRKNTLTPSVVLKTHKILMLHQPLQPDQKGYFRRVGVTVGGRLGLNWEKISEAIQGWCDLHDVKGMPFTEGMCKDLHIEYEKIHPFVDGNGRTGRMFMNWARIKKADLPILTIHAETPEQWEYYTWFK